MTNSELEKIRSLIYKETGMLFEDKKNYYISSRVHQRMLETGAESFDEYYNTLMFEPLHEEMQKFIEVMTINETYFFRDFPQLQGFAENVLPFYLEKKRKAGDFNLRIWSAACSTGEEAYTLSIILQEMIPDYLRWKIHINATDIDRTVLTAATKGVYGDRSMKDVPDTYKAKYFTSEGSYWNVNKKLKDSVSFSQINFVDRMVMRTMRGYDFVFCRNVLIYFDDESRRRVVNSLYDSLVPGGHLFLGHSESIGRITAAFEFLNIEGFLCYRRPL